MQRITSRKSDAANIVLIQFCKDLCFFCFRKRKASVWIPGDRILAFPTAVIAAGNPEYYPKSVSVQHIILGSGTVHDISRYVAFQYKIPFISVPTAASAEGFVSTEAEMVWNGQKKMIAAEAPIAVYADTDIFANAPTELNLSGAIRVNSSDTYLTERKISETQIKEGDPDTCEKLMYALLRSGVAGQAEGE